MYKSQHAKARLAQASSSRSKRQVCRTNAVSVGATASRARGDPGIPNLDRLKARLDKRAATEREKELRRNRRHTLIEAKRRLPTRLSADVAEAADDTSSAPSARRTHYFSELRRVIDQSDVVLLVVDARDPLSGRSEEIETAIVSASAADGANHKRLVLVLNKTDLVAPDNLQRWIKFLKRSYPVVAFKSSLQQQSSHLNTYDLTAADATPHRSGAVGARALIELLKNYCRSKLKVKKHIVVGVIGMPNVGKSSLINSLKRSRVAATGADAGVTRTLQTIKLDANITLIDSPGVIVTHSADDADTAHLLMRNCLRVDRVDSADVMSAAELICRRCDVTSVYDIPPDTTADAVIPLIATRFGKLLSGGLPNLQAAARIVVDDFNRGKIPFETSPPTDDAPAIVSSDIVSAWANEFDIEKLLKSKERVAVEHDEHMSIEQTEQLDSRTHEQDDMI